MTVLINAQWQASGCGHRYPIGAERILNMLPSNMDLVVPDISYIAGQLDVTDGIRNKCEVLRSLEIVRVALNRFSTPLFNLGCDCGGELVPIAQLNEKYGGDLRVIWFDAHPDPNTAASSQSHTFHGMVLRALLGDIPDTYAGLLQVPLVPKNIILAGTRDIDPEEQRCIDECGISVLSPEVLNGQPASDHLKNLENGLVYVHIDYDILDPVRHQDAEYQAKHGVGLARLLDWVRLIRSGYDVVGFGLTEFAPSSILSDDQDVKTLLPDGFGLQLR